MVQPSPTFRPPQNAASPASEQQASQSDTDLFIYCCVCFQPVSSHSPGNPGTELEDGTPPFWLTSCGHITCTCHIFPKGVPQNAARNTHDCPYCQSTGVSVTCLGVGEVPMYLQDYFRPTRELLGDFCGAMMFQYNNLQRAATHFKNLAQDYRERTEKHRVVLKSVRDELAVAGTLKRENEDLKEEIAKLRTILEKYEASTSTGAQITMCESGNNNNNQQVAQPAVQLQLSPGAIISQKRKSSCNVANSEVNDDPKTREKRFREEMNARQAMPPPVGKPQHVRRNIVASTLTGSHPYQKVPHKYMGKSHPSIDNCERAPDTTESHQAAAAMHQEEYNLRAGNDIQTFHKQSLATPNCNGNIQLRPCIDSGAGQAMGSTVNTRHEMIASRPGSDYRFPPPSSSSQYSGIMISQNASQKMFRTPPSKNVVTHKFRNTSEQIPPFIDELFSRTYGARGSGSLRLSATETSNNWNHPCSPVERLSLPTKPIARNQPRTPSRLKPSVSSPFFRDQMSSGGTQSSHTLRGSSRSGTSIGIANYNRDFDWARYGDQANADVPKINLDSGGFFRRDSNNNTR